jgi:hypothetical protein
MHCAQLLIERTTQADSAERFNKLCKLVSDAVIGGAWIFASDRKEVMEASIEGLLPIIESLKLGNVRFLRVKYYLSVCAEVR